MKKDATVFYINIILIYVTLTRMQRNFSGQDPLGFTSNLMISFMSRTPHTHTPQTLHTPTHSQKPFPFSFSSLSWLVGQSNPEVKKSL
ncbi:hypothetical protein L1887_32063 [Cichorium endivia]|nr:hypothetical protein L1887_32063 [Cichorium endivia]